MDVQCLSDFIKQALEDNMPNIDENGLLNNKKIHTVNYEDVLNNKYKQIENSKGCMGVYFLYSVKEVLYVGSSYTKNGDRDLYDRLRQHFINTDNAGLPYKLGLKELYKSSKFKGTISEFKNDENNEENIKNKAFEYIEEFKNDNIKVSYINIPKNNTNSQDVKFLESFYIGILKPKYNFMD